jgi:putative transposase
MFTPKYYRKPETQQRVDLAFKSFFRRVKAGDQGKAGYPRFKGKGWYDSFTYPQLGYSVHDDSTLRISKIGNVKIKLHRVIGIEGTIKRLNINRRATGKWFACFTVDTGPKILENLEKQDHSSDAAVGIDVGLTSFATLSNGEHIENPRFFKTEQNALAKAQRTLSAQEKGTPQRAKKRKVVARVHERIANRRNNFAHQLSRKLVNTYHTIPHNRLRAAEYQRHDAKRVPRHVDRRRSVESVHHIHKEQS